MMDVADLLAYFDGEQLLADLDTLGEIGLTPGAGLQRMAYSPADLAGRAWVLAEMQRLGMRAQIDGAGNVIGFHPGTEELPPLALGSHTDSVPGGGKFDGTLGVLAALACVRTLRDAGCQLRHPLLVVDFAAEEATTAASPMGSLAFIGELDAAVLEYPAWHGGSTRDLLESTGFDPKAMVAQTPPCVPAAFLELHIEQGDNLDNAGIAIGVVAGIVGIRCYYAVFTGQANHAGTTSMDRRRDALVAAAPFITAVRAVAVAHGIVRTVGRLQVEPGAPNVIPGRVTVDVEIRAMDKATLDLAAADLAAAAAAHGGRLVPGMAKTATPADPRIMATIADACARLDLTCTTMPSGAGHDAMNMARLCPYGMILIPSVAGISHAPDEYTHPQDCANGARVLLSTLVALDQQWDS